MSLMNILCDVKLKWHTRVKEKGEGMGEGERFIHSNWVCPIQLESFAIMCRISSDLQLATTDRMQMQH